MQITNEFMVNNSFDAATNLKAEIQSMYDLALRLEPLVAQNPESKILADTLKSKISNLSDEIEELSSSLCEVENERENPFSSIPRPRYSTDFKMRDTNTLIIDDNNINNYVISQMLTHFNITADVATNGEAAMELFKKKNYDIVLLDYLMPPGIDGIETAKRIREFGERGENQLIIGLTSNNMQKFGDLFNKYNIELILFKPLNYYHMSIVLRREFPDKIIA